MYSFLYVSFSFKISHINFLMRQCQRKGICYIIYFPHRGFWKMIFEAYWPYGQGVIRLRLWVYLEGLLTLVIVYYGVSPYFPTGFEGVLPIIPELLWFFLQGFSKISSHFFWKIFGGAIYISYLLIFPIGFFKDFLIHYNILRRSNWLQDHKKKKIDQGGVLWRN